MEASVIGVMGTVLGVLLAGPITFHFSKVLVEKTHANALALMKRQEANKAFLALEATFLPALRILKRTGTTDFDKIPTFFDNQEIAMLAFVWHLSGESRTDFEEKWQKYKDWQKEKMLEDIIEAAKKY